MSARKFDALSLKTTYLTLKSSRFERKLFFFTLHRFLDELMPYSLKKLFLIVPSVNTILQAWVLSCSAWDVNSEDLKSKSSLRSWEKILNVIYISLICIFGITQILWEHMFWKLNNLNLLVSCFSYKFICHAKCRSGELNFENNLEFHKERYHYLHLNEIDWIVLLCAFVFFHFIKLLQKK